MGRPKLLLVSPLPPPSGGIASWTRDILQSSIAEHFDLRILNTAHSANEGVARERRLNMWRVVHMVRVLCALGLELIRFRPALLYVSTSFHWGFVRDGLAVWMGQLVGAKAIVHVHGGDLEQWVEVLPPIPRYLVLVTLRRAEAVIALTRATEQWLATVCPSDRVHYLPNFVRIAESPLPRKATRECVQILYVGWMIEAKGVRELLRAASELRGAVLTLIGPSEPAFMAEISPQVAALAGRVRVLPPEDRDDIRRRMRGADILVLPTWREGFPIAVLEAMEAALPVVATPVGAIPEAISHEHSGLLVPVRDPDSLRAALQRLVDDPELRNHLGAAARLRVESDFSFVAVVARLERVLTATLAQN